MFGDEGLLALMVAAVVAVVAVVMAMTETFWDCCCCCCCCYTFNEYGDLTGEEVYLWVLLFYVKKK